ncbi:UDP-glucose/galactose:(glucosyl)LPS alpha-1,2-glucosyl/galactosyltransferase/UDP-glucose:(galactosyl)LPS alpha-1,2-glucosyltransferase/(galactosyl)LPS 1,2-glucosyltransferase [Enterobacter sp. BIGb0383]|uniref:glycosyltransferase family 8 protein n=1 Tax=unclassified Enterobacter TaxID=2608935 RepID=UPI000F4717BB|nr:MULTISPECIES: glycosyltransferase [unclassified Enterobacter]ROP56233.1 UDP-glucose/galactose:(glucosyl)LPS alpha-1,2-glucosyl/galactosyltransferase/UDP-glucose:(galactosyl)LPS alpha-1,2-glucosyltransferase/(galactosyl)LPS 1,2-glucosyltransferase [Enterobacter sp. BIGb0383]ROS05971.1 UDP-glucose/galactose:(glucosyl)LPS alpha-1,2-glucosyl/galactosyltransferase/UDP-glucose:(galactosyl)LPS alpha-1,2-glucosyltransferase/(galactosyl)LPS 1,2-glucosyltransferase [Enterobacter sp. BIGb0359]
MIFDCHQSIKKILEFNHAPVGQDSQLNVAWGVDKNFMFGAAISMTSVLQHNSDLNIHFHLLTDYFDDDYQQKVITLAKQFSTNISIYIINAEGLKVLPCGNAWSHATYFRFIAFEYLSEKIDELLYIDADVVCKGSLIELTKIQFDDRVAAVIQDVEESRSYAAERLNIPEFNDEYFNAGVIYANLREWKKQEFFSKAFSILLDKNNKFAFLDQDVLNIMFRGKTIFLPRIYDAIYGIKQELKSKNLSSYKEYITEDTILIHYIGVTKPWNSWANYPSAQYFVDAWKASPWADVPLLPARTPKQYKKKSRHERLQGKYISSILSYIGYLKEKVKGK